ncbi:SDR family NAD(P)-dependent oxidoreductase [Qipengyuania atrilutea]|uniref:SDR family NAD(P)-dependent oxidoreductase n=1 Tax=Qipengyuania atrilutea TaxID=2744473 RepID=A0A850GWJ7_9SPHN|nr:SDR family NAD(P)-dependent oxidoreductase [Actirhodobacter atriluteus]NVD43911.1 SDR family NAD(P)-dependent oxidoreductase [Actirhodobacter atriluteus]
MMQVGQESADWPRRAAIFGASGGIGRALAKELAGRGVSVLAASRAGADLSIAGAEPFAFDLTDEGSIARVAQVMSGDPPDLVIVATGALTLSGGEGPERSYKHIDAKVMQRIFAVNTIGPALVAKHMLALFKRDRRSVFAVLSARVGSIEDNRIGGWHSYRASKAALNMLVRNFAIELGRTHKHAIAVALHPGTVDTSLSEPFQANVPDEQLFAPARAARQLFDVIDGLGTEDSGKHFDWQGKPVPA